VLEKSHSHPDIDEKWLQMFDTLIVQIIDTRCVVDFARGEKCIDWNFIKEAIAKDLR